MLLNILIVLCDHYVRPRLDYLDILLKYISYPKENKIKAIIEADSFGRTFIARKRCGSIIWRKQSDNIVKRLMIEVDPSYPNNEPLIKAIKKRNINTILP